MSDWASRTLLLGMVFLLGTGTAGAWEIPAQVKVELVRVVTEDGVTLQAALYRPEPKVNARPKRAVLVTHGTGGSFYGSITGFLPPLLAEKGYLGLGLNRRDSGHSYYRCFAHSADYHAEVEQAVRLPAYYTHFPLSILPAHRASTYQAVDVHPPCRGKAEALRFLLEHFGIPPERVVAVGDASNDVPMVRAAGLGVAMENSMKELLEVADRVIGHHDTTAISELIEELFL